SVPVQRFMPVVAGLPRMVIWPTPVMFSALSQAPVGPPALGSMLLLTTMSGEFHAPSGPLRSCANADPAKPAPSVRASADAATLSAAKRPEFVFFMKYTPHKLNPGRHAPD